MKDNRVALYGEPPCVPLHLYHLQHLRSHFQFHCANVNCVFLAIAEGQHRLRHRVVAQHEHFQFAASIGKDREIA